MNKKQILYEALGGKKFKVEPLSSGVYYFHFSWVAAGELQVLIGDSNTQRGKGLFDSFITEKDGDVELFLDSKVYVLQHILLPFTGDIKTEVSFIEKSSGKPFRLKEEEKLNQES